MTRAGHSRDATSRPRPPQRCARSAWPDTPAAGLVSTFVGDTLEYAVWIPIAILFLAGLLAGGTEVIWRIRYRKLTPCECHHDFGPPRGNRHDAAHGLQYTCRLCSLTLKRVDDTWPPTCTRLPHAGCGWPRCMPIRGWRDVPERSKDLLVLAWWNFSDERVSDE